MAKSLRVACSPVDRTIYAGKAVPMENGAFKWLGEKTDVTQQAVIAAATYLGQPGAFLELSGPGRPPLYLALLSGEDFALLEAARLANAKQKAGK